MNSILKVIFATALLAATGSLLAAPLTQEPEAKIALVVKPSSLVSIHAAIDVDSGQRKLRGYALRRPVNKSAGSGHVDIEAFSSSGDSIAFERVALMPTPLPNTVLGKSTFLWNLPERIEAGSRVELRYHRGSHPVAQQE